MAGGGGFRDIRDLSLDAFEIVNNTLLVIIVLYLEVSFPKALSTKFVTHSSLNLATYYIEITLICEIIM